MRSRQTEYPSCPLPLLPSEVLRSRAEDPGFAEVLGRARALARREPYNPEVHHPNAPRAASHLRVTKENMAKLEALLDVWRKRAPLKPYRAPEPKPVKKPKEAAPPRRERKGQHRNPYLKVIR